MPPEAAPCHPCGPAAIPEHPAMNKISAIQPDTLRRKVEDAVREAIVAEWRALQQGALFDGYRGSPALDVEALADLVATLGRVMTGTPAIREIEGHRTIFDQLSVMPEHLACLLCRN